MYSSASDGDGNRQLAQQKQEAQARDGLGGRPNRPTSRNNREALALPLPKALKAAPAPILQKLKEAMVKVKADPATVEQLKKQEIEPWTRGVPKTMFNANLYPIASFFYGLRF